MLHDAVSRLTKRPPATKNKNDKKTVSQRFALFRPVEFRSKLFNPLDQPTGDAKCERDPIRTDPMQLAQELLSSELLQAKFTQAGGWADQLLKDRRNDQLKAEDVFLATLTRRPSPAQKDGVVQFIQANRSIHPASPNRELQSINC